MSATVIKLGATPKVFKQIPVKFTLPDGGDGAIPVVFKYRTRSGYALYLNDLYATSEAEKPPEGAKLDFVELFAKGGEKTVSQLLNCVESWVFDYDLTKENLTQMQDEIPAAIAAMGEAYRAACVEGKLGN